MARADETWDTAGEGGSKQIEERADDESTVCSSDEILVCKALIGKVGDMYRISTSASLATRNEPSGCFSDMRRSYIPFLQ